jgi:phenylalanyl-tRNA synthetase beta chain
MLISLDWIRDYVDLPADLDPAELAERFTRTTAEVESVKQVKISAKGLIAARVESAAEIPGTQNLRLVVLDVGQGRTLETVTAAPALHVGTNVVYARDGASLATMGNIGTAKVADKSSVGMILPADAVGIEMAAQEAVFLNNAVQPGEELSPDLFDDWLIEIDNKSITHRPDLWGHYGIAREIAAICGRPLKPYPAVPLEELADKSLPEVPIEIADGNACRRYSGIVLEGVPTQPGPLWMQLRLGRVGMRPISGLVDLTNYIMADLGQPMHAFDAAKVPRIEVDWAEEGEVFRTLDGVDRKLTIDELMIRCNGRSIALAGVMGGLETEVSDMTVSLLLESANFDPATIRRTATRLGLRTDASARFEKSLDPANTVLSIRRFIQLARPIYPELTIKSSLSDCFPTPLESITVRVNPGHVARTIGREVAFDEASRILVPLGFQVGQSKSEWTVKVPSFRATNDVSIEEDVVEELARCIGYDNIAPAMPRISMRRFEPNDLHELEQQTIEYFTSAHRFIEIQGYLWYDSNWLDQLGINPGPCVELRNPAADGLHRFRRSLIPGLLAAVERNRFHFPAFSLIELGGVFEKGADRDEESRHVGLILARRGKRAEDELHARLKGAIEGWAWQRFARRVTFSRAAAEADRPWEHPHRTATVLVDGLTAGRVSVIDRALRQAMSEHLSAWAIVWAELRLDGLETLDHLAEPLGRVPAHPLVEMDFSILVGKATPYSEVVRRLTEFDHTLLKRIRYVGSYEGQAVGPGQRSITFRTVVGDDARTLAEEDVSAFRGEFEQHVKGCGFEIRS